MFKPLIVADGAAGQTFTEWVASVTFRQGSTPFGTTTVTDVALEFSGATGLAITGGLAPSCSWTVLLAKPLPIRSGMLHFAFGTYPSGSSNLFPGLSSGRDYTARRIYAILDDVDFVKIGQSSSFSLGSAVAHCRFALTGERAVTGFVIYGPSSDYPASATFSAQNYKLFVALSDPAPAGLGAFALSPLEMATRFGTDGGSVAPRVRDATPDGPELVITVPAGGTIADYLKFDLPFETLYPLRLWVQPTVGTLTAMQEVLSGRNGTLAGGAAYLDLLPRSNFSYKSLQTLTAAQLAGALQPSYPATSEWILKLTFSDSTSSRRIVAWVVDPAKASGGFEAAEARGSELGAGFVSFLNGAKRL